MRIAVVQRDDQAEKHLVVGRVVEKTATLGVIVERPARRVHDEPLLVQLGVNLPDLLDANAVVLGVGIRAQVELLHQLFAEITAHTLGENRVLAE